MGTKLIAHLPNVDVEVTRRRLPELDAERMAIPIPGVAIRRSRRVVLATTGSLLADVCVAHMIDVDARAAVTATGNRAKSSGS